MRNYTNNSQTNARVSIGLPVYNGENFLAEAIKSVLGQTYDQLELIISDNGSTDATEEICRSFAQKDGRIRYLRSDTNNGAAWNYNQTFYEAKGEFFRWLAHDDMLAPTLLEKSVFILDSYPEVVLCFSWSKDIDQDGIEVAIKPSTRHYADPHANRRFFSLSEIVPWHNCEEVFGLIRSDVLKKSRLISNYTDSDRSLLAELALYGPFYEIPEPLFLHRIHEESSVVTNPDNYERTVWFDPSLEGKLISPGWRQFSELLRMPVRVPLPLRERALSYYQLLRFLKRRRRVLTGELRRGFAYLTRPRNADSKIE